LVRRQVGGSHDARSSMLIRCFWPVFANRACSLTQRCHCRLHLPWWRESVPVFNQSNALMSC